MDSNWLNLYLKEEGLEEVGGIDNAENKEGRQVGGQHLVDDPTLQDDHHVHALCWWTCTDFRFAVYLSRCSTVLR